ncbi:aldo/keto reductase [Haloarchaeobius sp. HME9146]|uniref:aldo/keto reductase n=1 Tax=Haloarchaeobius sp. HME9146 TaxID=2978732 RepID=UPI0021C14588|nr:aldo/keto reductase [Haloarchaeobius sp. HME9146]MCT9095820.1 aldo/keto reductase [Haloarchaeobius sp. HME9146]
MVTSTATWAYRDAFHESFGRTYFRRFGDSLVSSIGVGTYLGDPTDEVDERYHESIVKALESGINVVDTAINYRCQRSERVVGGAVREADVERDAVLVSTKGGFVPFDGERPANPGQYVQSEYVDSGIVDPDDLVSGCHCIVPGYIADQLDRSLDNLGLDHIDLYYVHNPETQLVQKSHEEVYDQLEATFELLERRADEGDIQHYGVASWECFRVGPGHDSYLSLSEVVGRARSAAKTVGNAATHFRAIQLPFNVHMADAFTVEGQSSADGTVSTLALAHQADLDVFTSASILQGDLTSELPDEVAAKLAGDSVVQQAINFARSAPGVTSSLVGMSRPEHVEENVAAGTFDPMGADAFDSTFE